MILSNKYRLLDKIGKNNKNCYWLTLLSFQLQMERTEAIDINLFRVD